MDREELGLDPDRDFKLPKAQPTGGPLKIAIPALVTTLLCEG